MGKGKEWLGVAGVGKTGRKEVGVWLGWEEGKEA